MSNFVTGHLVQNRLRQLADDAKPGTDKIKSQSGGGGGMGQLMCLSIIGSIGPMNLYCRVRK